MPRIDGRTVVNLYLRGAGHGGAPRLPERPRGRSSGLLGADAGTSDSRFRALALDARDVGQSDSRVAATTRRRDLADDVAAWLEALGGPARLMSSGTRWAGSWPRSWRSGTPSGFGVSCSPRPRRGRRMAAGGDRVVDRP